MVLNIDFKDFPYICVTVGNSPTAPDTLGIYQPLYWARLAGKHVGVITTERSHISTSGGSPHGFALPQNRTTDEIRSDVKPLCVTKTSINH